MDYEEIKEKLENIKQADSKKLIFVKIVAWACVVFGIISLITARGSSFSFLTMLVVGIILLYNTFKYEKKFKKEGTLEETEKLIVERYFEPERYAINKQQQKERENKFAKD